MSKAEKAGEPSMDEILASIRKIIAEDPVVARKPRDERHSIPQANAGDVNETPAATTASSSARKSTLDDVLGMADFGSDADDPRPAADSRRASADWPPPSWPTATTETAPKLEAERTRAPAPAAMEAPKPFFPAPTAFPMPASANATRAAPNPATPSPAAPAERPVTFAPTTPKAIDIGAIIPQRLQDHMPDLSSGAGADRKGQPGRLPDWLSRPAPSPTRPAPEPTLDRAKAALREPVPSTLSLSELANAKTMVVTPIASSSSDGADIQGGADAQAAVTATPVSKPATDLPLNGHHGVEPSKTSSARGEPVVATKAAETQPEPAVAASMFAARADSATPDVAVALDATSGLAPTETADPAPEAASEPSVGGSDHDATGGLAETIEAVTPAPGAAVADPVKLPATSAVATVPKPSLLGERNRAAKVQAGSELVPTVGATSLGQLASGQPGGLRTLEDTVVELLRPMLRQWLDDNMPRMVEKALRIELAQSIKPTGDASKH